jgi:hypothetical protein
MGNRALQLVTLLVAVAVGVGAAVGVRAVRNVSPQQASSNTSTSPSASPSLGASPSLSSSPISTESPSPSPLASPSAPSRTGAAYPQQIQAGTVYQYTGSSSLAALASDSSDGGSSVCAGINTTSQLIPPGYLAAYFVSVTFRDGQVISSGYLRQGSTSNDWGQLQNSSTKDAKQESSPTPAGTHTYCVTRSGGAWITTADGATIYTTTAEPATSFAGTILNFESTIQRKPDNSGPVKALSFFVPGFKALAIDGQPPTQLKGATKIF